MTKTDLEANKVYYWESAYVEPYQAPFDLVLTKDQVLKYVRDACSFSHINQPEIIVRQNTLQACEADVRKWQIIIAGWGMNAVTVLHEVAHLATTQAVRRGENPHGPSFVEQCIQYYSEICGIDKGHLISTAIKCGIKKGVLEENAFDKSPFADLDF